MVRDKDEVAFRNWVAGYGRSELISNNSSLIASISAAVWNNRVRSASQLPLLTLHRACQTLVSIFSLIFSEKAGAVRKGVDFLSGGTGCDSV